MKKITAFLLLAAFTLITAGCHSLENRTTLPVVDDEAIIISETEPPATSVPQTEYPDTSSAPTDKEEDSVPSEMPPANDNTTEETPQTSPDTPKGTVKISFVGDTTQSGLFADATENAGIHYAFSDVAPIFDSCDISFANLETCISNRGVSEKKEGFGFRSSPDKLEVYGLAGIDIVSVANNHTRDFGMDALDDTFTYLDEYDIEYVGGGRNISEARQMKIIEANGYKVGFVAYNMIMHNETWYATDTRAGIAGLDYTNEEEILAEIAEYNEQCDILAVSVHWGIEYLNEALGDQEILGRKFVDNGADIVIGHHPHVLEPVELYKGAPLFYSIGNVVFFKMNDEAGQSAVFTAEFDENGFKAADMYPVHINLCRANLLEKSSEMYAEIIDRMNRISAMYGTRITDDGEILFD